MPSPFRKNGRIGPGRHDFGDEQVVALLVVRLRDHLAFQPGRAIADERRADPFSRKGRQAGMGELVAIAAGHAAGGQHLVRDPAERHVEGEFSRSVDQFAGESAAVDDRDHLGRIEVERHHPGSRHDVPPPVESGADQSDRSVIEQQIAFGQIDGLYFFTHMKSGSFRKFRSLADITE